MKTYIITAALIVFVGVKAADTKEIEIVRKKIEIITKLPIEAYKQALLTHFKDGIPNQHHAHALACCFAAKNEENDIRVKRFSFLKNQMKVNIDCPCVGGKSLLFFGSLFASAHGVYSFLDILLKSGANPLQMVGYNTMLIQSIAILPTTQAEADMMMQLVPPYPYAHKVCRKLKQYVPAGTQLPATADPDFLKRWLSVYNKQK